MTMQVSTSHILARQVNGHELVNLETGLTIKSSKDKLPCDLTNYYPPIITLHREPLNVEKLQAQRLKDLANYRRKKRKVIEATLF